MIALVLGGLIYVLAVTGTTSVFNREFQRWEQPLAPEMLSIAPTAAAAAAAEVFESEAQPTTHLYINFPQPDLPRTVITTDTQAFFANADGTIAGREHFPWTQFLLDLHYYLHLPQVLGLTVVGALGAFLVAMSISGFMAHPRIFRDAFTVRRGAGRLPITDLHNRLSVWTAPFHISNALTGAMLGLATILAGTIAAFSFNNDFNAVFSPIFGEEPAADGTAAPLAKMAVPLEFMAEQITERPATFLILHDPATAGQHVSVIAAHHDRLIFGEYYNFDAAGNFEGNVGISDGTVGQQIAGSIYNLHFGNWGGLPIKFAYVVFGLALCTIIASGLRIYFARRQDQGRPVPAFAAVWEAVVWGTPLLLALTLLASTLGLLEGAGLVALFWLSLGFIMSIAAFRRHAAGTGAVLKVGLVVALAATVIAHSVRHAAAIFTAPTLSVSLPLLAIAFVMLLPVLRRRDGTGREGPSTAESGSAR